MKGPVFFQGEIITKWWKYIDEIKKIFFSRTTDPISTKLGTKHPWGRRFKFVQIKGPVLFQEEIITNSENTLTKLKKSHHQNYWANFNLSLVRGIQVSSNEKTINDYKVNNVFFLLLINVMILSYVIDLIHLIYLLIWTVLSGDRCGLWASSFKIKFSFLSPALFMIDSQATLLTISTKRP